MREDVGTLVALIITGVIALSFFAAAHNARKSATRNQSDRGDEHSWLDEPGDDVGSGWTNFDYIAANELEDEWSGTG